MTFERWNILYTYIIGYNAVILLYSRSKSPMVTCEKKKNFAYLLTHIMQRTKRRSVLLRVTGIVLYIKYYTSYCCYILLFIILTKKYDDAKKIRKLFSMRNVRDVHSFGSVSRVRRARKNRDSRLNRSIMVQNPKRLRFACVYTRVCVFRGGGGGIVLYRI